MHSYKYFIYPLLTTIIIFCGCKLPQQAQQKSLLPMPQHYSEANVADTSNMVLLNPRQFFTNAHLTGLLDTALANNWDIQIALQRIRQAQTDVLFSKGMMKPFINASALPAITKFGEYTMDGAGNKNTTIYRGRNIPVHLADFFFGFQSSWEVDLWDRLRNKNKAAVARYLATQEGRHLVVTNLIANIATAYYDLLWYDQSLKIIDTTIALQENILLMVRVQKQAAAATELAVKQFEAQLLNLRSMRLETVRQILTTENAINLLIGRYPQPVSRDTSFNVSAPSLQLNPGIPSQLLQNRPDIRQAEFELVAARADMQSAKASFYPSLNMGAGIGLEAFKPDLLLNATSITYNLLGSFTAPLVNRTAIQAEFARADAFRLEAMQNYQKAIVSGYIEVYNELIRINNLQKAFELKSAEVNTLEQSVEISSLLFRSSRANYLEVLFVQQNLLQSKLQLAEIRKNSIQAYVNLYRELGGGWR